MYHQSNILENQKTLIGKAHPEDVCNFAQDDRNNVFRLVIITKHPFLAVYMDSLKKWISKNLEDTFQIRNIIQKHLQFENWYWQQTRYKDFFIVDMSVKYATRLSYFMLFLNVLP